MDWGALVSNLQHFIEQIGETTVDMELQAELTAIMRRAWDDSTGAARRNRIPDLGSLPTSVAMLMLAKALTAEPERACNAVLEENSELAWLRLAAATSCHYALASVATSGLILGRQTVVIILHFFKSIFIFVFVFFSLSLSLSLPPCIGGGGADQTLIN